MWEWGDHCSSSRYFIHDYHQFDSRFIDIVYGVYFLFISILEETSRNRALLSHNIIPRIFCLLRNTDSGRKQEWVCVSDDAPYLLLQDESRHTSDDESADQLGNESNCASEEDSAHKSAKDNEDESEGEYKEKLKIERKRKQLIDLYCIRILIELTLHSNPSEFQGSFSDTAFASLLVSSLFSDSYFLRYGGFIIVESWIRSSTSHKELFSSIAIPSSFISLLTQCPTKEEDEKDLEFKYRFRSFLKSMIHALAVVISSIGIGMRMNESSEETLTTSLNTLSTDINNAEQSYQDEDYILKEELENLKKKIAELNGIVAMEDEMIEKDMDEAISILDEDGNTIVHLLAMEEEDEKEILRAIDDLMKGPNWRYNGLIDGTNSNGTTPLHIASWYGYLSVVDYLVDHGGDVNKADKYGETPLWIASEYGHLSIVEYLINHGAD